MPTFGVQVKRDKDYQRFVEAADRWAARKGLVRRGRGFLSAYVRHLLEQGARDEERRLTK